MNLHDQGIFIQISEFSTIVYCISFKVSFYQALLDLSQTHL